MANILHLTLRGVSPDDVDAPLTEEELGKLEAFIAKVRTGEFKVTDDPAQRDEWLREGATGVMCWRESGEGE